jgi:uncharacterized protein (TIGR03086 family)
VADRVPLDFDPPVRQLRALLLGIADDDLTAATPCDEWTVGDLLDHIMDFTRAFTQAAQKLTDAPGTSTPAPVPSAADLPPYWRSRLPVLLEELATAWKDPAAWTGSARSGGATMPAVAAGTAAVNELAVHGWDLARATGQDYAADPRILEALIEFLSPSQKVAAEDEPSQKVRAEDEPNQEDEPALLDQVLVLSGRDPRWRPPSRPTFSARSTSAAE